MNFTFGPEYIHYFLENALMKKLCFRIFHNFFCWNLIPVLYIYNGLREYNVANQW